jgi:hypothetical protein
VNDQLALTVEPALRWTARCIWCGAVLDDFTDEELATVAAGMPEKAWQEATMWAHLAVKVHEPTCPERASSQNPNTTSGA